MKCWSSFYLIGKRNIRVITYDFGDKWCKKLVHLKYQSFYPKGKNGFRFYLKDENFLILSSVEDFYFSLSFVCKMIRFSEQKLPMWQKKRCQIFKNLTKSYSSQVFYVGIPLQMVFKWKCHHYQMFMNVLLS